MEVEDKGNGTAYIQLRQGKAPAPIIAIIPETEGNKWNRMDKCTPLFESGKVHLPKKAPWLTDYETEILEFTGKDGDPDDFTDSTSQYLMRFSSGKRKGGTRKLKGAGSR